jgi:predicted nucleic acid-binding protein
MYVVDASVWISGFLTFDSNYSPSSQWLERVGRRRILLAAPLILLAEVGGAIARRTADSSLARRYIRRLETLPHTRLLSFDLGAWRRSATLAADLRLRGADALYVSLGLDLGMQLVTWDEQQRQRATALISVTNPLDLLSQGLP